MISGTVLHPGCGHEPLPEWLSGCTETRLDIDPTCDPDIVASITDMGDIGEFDKIYTCHTLEHLYHYDTETALKEFLRVLKPGGTAIIFVPDVEGVTCNHDFLYESCAGPICGIDLFYGLTSYVKVNPHYAHHMAFTRDTLEKAMVDAGFSRVSVTRQLVYNLMGVGFKPV